MRNLRRRDENSRGHPSTGYDPKNSGLSPTADSSSTPRTRPVGRDLPNRLILTPEPTHEESVSLQKPLPLKFIARPEHGALNSTSAGLT